MIQFRLCHLSHSHTRLFYLFAFVLLIAVVSPVSAQNSARRNQPGAGQRAVVIDERLSALREQPEVTATLRQRLRRGRIVSISKTASQKGGPAYCLVAVTRRTRGWVLAESLARSGSEQDARRLLKMIEETRDDFIRARLARICADEFSRTASASRALLLLGEAAEAASQRLSREARKRAGTDGEESDSVSRLSRRDYLLNHTGLDRWNRAGIAFSYEADTDGLVYDGAAWRELLRKYPRSDEAQQAQERLKQIKTTAKN
ncbi:MAG: hypothetical protein U0Z53_15675 [Blastocatellia bacterium]